MKRLKMLPLMLLALCSSVAFVACSDDDDEPGIGIKVIKTQEEFDEAFKGKLIV